MDLEQNAELRILLRCSPTPFPTLTSFNCRIGLFKHPLSLRKTGETLFPTTEVSQGRVIPLLAGARVFPEAQPREWAAPANSSSEGLGNNSGVNGGRACRRCGPEATTRFFEFFMVPVRNKNTRIVYYHAIGEFLAWSQRCGFLVWKTSKCIPCRAQTTVYATIQKILYLLGGICCIILLRL